MTRIDEKKLTHQEYVLHCLQISKDTAAKRIAEIRRTEKSIDLLDEAWWLDHLMSSVDFASDMIKRKQYKLAITEIEKDIPPKAGKFREALTLLFGEERTLFRRLTDPQLIRLHLLAIVENLKLLDEDPTRAEKPIN